MLTERIYNELFNRLKNKLNFSYKIIETPNYGDISEKSLNEFSENGWELVSVIDNVQENRKYFKIVFRRLNEEWETE